uniref:Ovule protein n=1 Tax=Haemonchus placei TaxID=6290 RepID=A0A0N4WRD8_HAEPC
LSTSDFFFRQTFCSFLVVIHGAKSFERRTEDRKLTVESEEYQFQFRHTQSN